MHILNMTEINLFGSEIFQMIHGRITCWMHYTCSKTNLKYNCIEH